MVAALGDRLTKSNASRRVLIVELDLRQARMSAAFGRKDRGGTIDDYLMGLKTLEECTKQHDGSGSTTSGSAQHAERAENPPDRTAMKAALATFSERYDLVIPRRPCR